MKQETPVIDTATTPASPQPEPSNTPAPFVLNSSVLGSSDVLTFPTEGDKR